MGHNFTYKAGKSSLCNEVKGVHEARNMQYIDVTILTINKRQFYFFFLYLLVYR